MAAGAALPGLLLVFAATVLLVFVSVSPPTWNKISFLDVTQGGKTTQFGVFGYTGSGKAHIGYTFEPDVLGYSDTKLNTGILHHLTYVLILYPVAAGLSGLSVLFGICGASYHRIGTVFMALLAALATLCTLVVWVISMVLFGIARKHIRDNGGQAQYGNANWLAVGALGALLIGFCASFCGVFGHYRRRRHDY
jgi:hypothetical protein